MIICGLCISLVFLSLLSTYFELISPKVFLTNLIKDTQFASSNSNSNSPHHRQTTHPINHTSSNESFSRRLSHKRPFDSTQISLREAYENMTISSLPTTLEEYTTKLLDGTKYGVYRGIPGCLITSFKDMGVAFLKPPF